MANCSRAPYGQYRISILTRDSLLIWKKWFIYYLANDTNNIFHSTVEHPFIYHISLFGMFMCKVDKYWHITVNMRDVSLKEDTNKCHDKSFAPWTESVSSRWLKLLIKFWFIVCYFYRENIISSTKHYRFTFNKYFESSQKLLKSNNCKLSKKDYFWAANFST